jgi:DNA uptake protein ComE-like DNA-binding protein
MARIRAAVCREFGKPLVIEEVELRAPEGREVEVTLAACAICHSDISFLDGGWGLVLAKRIIRYRESLGGFINVEQLRQVYGLDSATVTGLLSHGFIEGNFIPRKLNLNEVDEKLLSNHPYMSKADAKIIVMYRLQHGKFTSLVDLKKIHGIKEGTIDRILPYLEVD